MFFIREEHVIHEDCLAGLMFEETCRADVIMLWQLSVLLSSACETDVTAAAVWKWQNLKTVTEVCISALDIF